MGKITNRYAIVGIGESERSRKSGKTPLRMAVEASRAALADAGLEAGDIDGFMSYQEGDSCSGHNLATYLGVRPKYYKDIMGGGSSTEMLIADAVGLIDAGIVNTVLIFRSMNGRSGVRVGTGWDVNIMQTGLPGGSYVIPYGLSTPGEWFGMVATRHMYETGMTQEHLGHLCVTLYDNAQLNPKALFYGKPLTIEKYMNTPLLCYPFRLHDYCTETDEANAFIVTSAKRARDCKSKPVYIMGLAARQSTPHVHYWNNKDITKVASVYAAEQVYKMAGVKPSDIQVAAIYDCFSWVVLRQLEAYGLVGRGEAGPFAAAGNLRIGGKLPINTAGGMLSEGYTHGMNNLLELVRQLRHDYQGTPRQVEGCELGLCTGWAGPDTASAVILRS